MSNSGESTLARIGPELDPRITAVSETVLRGKPSASDSVNYSATLAAAISAAALAGWQQSLLDPGEPMEFRKKAIDGAATRGAESVLARASFGISVTAGEGQRDDSPGAIAGQWLGRRGPGGAAESDLAGVFDYVDGTTLAARRDPGAIALGGLGRDLRPVPDLQAYAILAPAEIIPELDIMTDPEEHAIPALSTLSSWLGKPVSELTVFTHSLESSLSHRELIDAMTARAGRVIVPELVTIEAPYIASLAGVGHPRIDCMIGAMGLSELAFAALLLDLIRPDYRLVFRVASIAGPRRHPEVSSTRPLFEFTDAELRAYAEAGLDPARPYTSADIVPVGAAVSAALFAVTDNAVLGLSQPTASAAGLRTEGLIFGTGTRVTRAEMLYKIS